MFYRFPRIDDISQVRAAMAAHRAVGEDMEFIEAERDGYLVFNYLVNFADTFRRIDTEDEALNEHRRILRECRGLIFCANTGKVLARRYHKFFNIGERDETQAHLIDLSLPHVILEKLDGSMITPFLLNGKIVWGTKMGVTGVAEPVAEWVSKNPSYLAFAEKIVGDGLTPIFEWCSRQQKIVIDYPVDRLVLTGIRDNTTGEYVSYSYMLKLGERWGVEVVRARQGGVASMEQFLDETSGLSGQEGWVLRFDSGHMFKIKATEYCQIHKTKDGLNLEKNVVQLVAGDKIDDLLPLMDDGDRERVNRFYGAFHHAVHETADRLFWIARAAYDNLNGSDKRFSLEVVNNHPVQVERSLLFSAWGLIRQNDHTTAADVAPAILKLILKNCGTSTKVNEVRKLFGGLSWYDFHTVVNLDD